MLERRATIQAETRDANHGKLDCQDIALLARGIVAGRAMDRSHRAVLERLGIELRGVQGGAIVPETDRVLGDHIRFSTRDRYVHSTSSSVR